jgi:hypothetical protein
MNEYYTYAYLREDGTPYYIGKGKDNRINRKRKYEIKPPKDKSRIIFLKQNLTEDEAFRHEIYMIVVFGRKDLGTGILYNRTDGGDGHSNPSLETRKKLSNRLKNRIFSSETLKKMSDSKIGVKKSEQHKNNISKTHKKRNNEVYRKYIYTFVSLEGKIFSTTKISDFCKENGLTYQKVIDVSKGMYKQHKGWKVTRKLKDVSK